MNAEKTARVLMLGGLIAALAGCPDAEDRPIEFSLPEEEYWPDLRDNPGIGDGRLIVTNNLDDTVSVLDLGLVGDDSLAELARIPVGFIPVEREGPHHLAVDPTGEFYYIGISNYVVGSGSGPHGVHGAGTADGHVLKIRASDDLPVGSVRVDRNPGDLAMSADGTLLLATHFDVLRITEVLDEGGDERDMDSRLAMLDPVSMERIAMVDACPAAHGIVITPDSTKAILSCLPDEIAVVDLVDEEHPVERVDVIPNPGPVSAPICEPYALTIAPAGDTVWVSCFGDGRVLPYDVAAGEMDATRNVSALPGPAVFGAFTRDGNTLYIPYQRPDGIAVIDPATGDLIQDVPFSSETCVAPHVLIPTDDETRLLVICEGDHVGPGSLLVMDRATMTPEHSVPLGIFPDDIGVLRGPVPTP